MSETKCPNCGSTDLPRVVDLETYYAPAPAPLPVTRSLHVVCFRRNHGYLIDRQRSVPKETVNSSTSCAKPNPMQVPSRDRFLNLGRALQYEPTVRIEVSATGRTFSEPSPNLQSWPIRSELADRIKSGLKPSVKFSAKPEEYACSFCNKPLHPDALFGEHKCNK